MGSRRGEINGWRCSTCLRVTYYVHVDDGVTPMFMACRASGKDPGPDSCGGMGASLMYPSALPPAHVVAAVQWEWYKPTFIELEGMDAGAREHVGRGGLLARQLTKAGRAILAEFYGGAET